MKGILLVILILFGVAEINAQRYIQFEQGGDFIGYHWSLDGWTLQYETVDFHQAIINNDAVDSMIQNGRLFTYFGYYDDIQIYSDRSWENYFYVWEDSISNLLMGIYPDYYPDSLSTRSAVLYDYNQNVGDTVHSDMLNLSSKAPYEIIGIDTIDYLGVLRRTLHCQSFTDSFIQFDIIEGLGTNLGFLTNVNLWIEGGTVLECAYLDDDVSYGNSSCFSSVTENLRNIQIYPNPFQNELFVELEEQINGVITITDLQGKLCYQEPINSLTSSLNLSSLHSGIYVLNLMNEKGEMVAHQKIVKL